MANIFNFVKSFICVFTFICMISLSEIHAQQVVRTTPPEQPRLTTKDLNKLTGHWSGTLTYLDYTSGKPFTMPVAITIRQDSTNSFQLIRTTEYPKEPQANGVDTIILSADQTMINGFKLISTTNDPDGSLKFVTAEDGIDGNDNKKAVILQIFTVTKTTFVKRKEVRFEGEKEFILRNEYKLSR